LGDSLLASFQDKAPTAQTAGACSTASQDSEETPAQAMQRLRDVQASGPKVLVVCGHPDADLASEMTHVSQYGQALKEAFGSHVMAYVSEMSAEVSSRVNLRLYAGLSTVLSAILNSFLLWYHDTCNLHEAF